MPFRTTFDCLWCGRPHTVRDATDVEGWAQLCPDCIGRAGDNSFLRYRLKAALAERGKARRPTDAATQAQPGRPNADAPPPADRRPAAQPAQSQAEAAAVDAARAEMVA